MALPALGKTHVPTIDTEAKEYLCTAYHYGLPCPFKALGEIGMSAAAMIKQGPEAPTVFWNPLKSPEAPMQTYKLEFPAALTG